jgi:hypothetical protein
MTIRSFVVTINTENASPPENGRFLAGAIRDILTAGPNSYRVTLALRGAIVREVDPPQIEQQWVDTTDQGSPRLLTFDEVEALGLDGTGRTQP